MYGKVLFVWHGYIEKLLFIWTGYIAVETDWVLSSFWWKIILIINNNSQDKTTRIVYNTHREVIMPTFSQFKQYL